jgi:large subunit ribosomal protein L37e
MTRGTPSFGKRNGRMTHGICRRCGKHSYFRRKGVCSSCGYGRMARIRSYRWNVKVRAFDGKKAWNGRKELAKRIGQKH